MNVKTGDAFKLIRNLSRLNKLYDGTNFAKFPQEIQKLLYDF